MYTCMFLYAPVFDDGDERTLKRSSLCLKGGRHFDKSEVSALVLRVCVCLEMCVWCGKREKGRERDCA